MSPRGIVTNLRIQSEDLSDAAYRKSVAVVGTYNGVLPTGVALARTLTDSGTSSTVYYAAGQLTLTPGVDYIASAMVKSNAGTGWFLLGGQGGASSASRYFNAATGAIGVNAGVAKYPNVDDTIGNGYLRVSHKFTAVSGIPNDLTIYLATGDGSATYTANGQSLIVTGMMVEVAAPGQVTPSPYTFAGATNGVGPRDSRENLATWSEDYTGTHWGRSSISAASAVDAPPGFSGSMLLTDTSDGSPVVHYVNKVMGVLDKSTPSVFAVRAKAGSKSILWLGDPNSGKGSYFDLLAGTGVTASVATKWSTGILPLGNGWYTCWTMAPVGELQSPYGYSFAMINTINSLTYTGTGTGTMLVTGAQVARTNQLPDYVRTTSGIYVPNGAPRLLAA